ncbi:MAG: glycoside hydrolase family 95 protein, partial [Bacteroidota bacterium]|nr:glycoside hydrolase family 95 protein [Bacteroidota bacterium]
MKKKIMVSLAWSLFCSCVFSQQDIKLWYQQPANTWTQALPIGNGRLGAMVFGKVGEELIQINESTLWSGGPVKTRVNPDAPKYLPLIRKALLEKEDYETAVTLTKKMQGLYSESYLPLGDILIKQNFKDTVASAYYRELNLQDALSTTRFTIDGNEYNRTIFSSAPDQIIIIRMTSMNPGGLNFLVTSKSLLNFKMEASADDELVM